MRILIATALYPPDVAEPAPYVKELATRLSLQHEVTVLTYGRLVEQVETVTTVSVPKSLPAAVRLLRFTKQLYKLSRQADCVLLQNAPATELPAALTALFFKRKTFMQLSDTKIKYVGWRAFVHRIATRRVRAIIELTPPHDRPLIYPFADYPTEAFAEYERSWDEHLSVLTTQLSKV